MTYEVINATCGSCDRMVSDVTLSTPADRWICETCITATGQIPELILLRELMEASEGERLERFMGTLWDITLATIKESKKRGEPVEWCACGAPDGPCKTCIDLEKNA